MRGSTRAACAWECVSRGAQKCPRLLGRGPYDAALPPLLLQIPYNPWDTGTTRRNETDEAVLAQLAAAVGVDFVNGDTMVVMDSAFWTDSVAAGNPLALQPEGGSALENLAWTKMGWGYWMNVFETVPIVDPWKFLEHRHITQICNRWATNHTLDLQRAFFNGDGFVPWESVWSIWNGLSLRDAEATRRVGALLRFLTLFFRAGPEATSTTWTPHTLVTAAAYGAGVFASQWVLPAGGGSPFKGDATAYTLVSNGSFAGPTLPVPCAAAGAAYFDLYAGAAAPLAPVPAPEGGCALPLAFEAGGFGAVLALGAADAAAPPAALAAFLAKMAQMTARPLASFDAAPTYLQQEMTFIAPAPLRAAPAGTVFVPGQAAWPFSVNGSEIEGVAGRNDTDAGMDVQFPWEELAHHVHGPFNVSVPDLFVDATPVTNAQYAAFLAASGYSPGDAYHFLRDWNGSRTPPAGWENKPVTWVDLLDARAYCAAAGKRLPHDWEWQYVSANGTAGKPYPWGAAWDATRVPPQQNGTARPPPPDVGSFPGGATPSGILDAVGLVWQWTDEFADAHTRAGLVRGGSYYTPVGSQWYFPNWIAPAPVPHPARGGFVSVNLNSHSKLLLMAPAYDRHGTVGFRCVADAV